MTERKTEQAKSLLVRYIRDQQMKRGDRLLILRWTSVAAIRPATMPMAAFGLSCDVSPMTMPQRSWFIVFRSGRPVSLLFCLPMYFFH